MDPNHWNTYNLQYGHSTPGGLPSAHPSLSRLDIASGLGLGHTLQTSHTTLGGRSVSAIPAVSYPGLAMPILDPITAQMSSSQTHKAMSLASGQLVFEQQLRGAEQQSPTIGRYDGSKGFRTDGMVRNQILEAAAARVLSTPNFASSSLYNQFGDIASSSANTISPSSGSGSSLMVSKSNQHMHEPPPAHSSSAIRFNSIQRNPHTADILYGRSTDALIPSSLAQISSLYSSVTLGKQGLGSNQQQLLHRQTPSHIQQCFSAGGDIEDLSSNSQNQIYSPYANLSVADAQDFPAAQLSGDINYEAVSPAPPMSESSQSNQEHSSFSIVQFPELINLTPEHAHTLADKFQENDFRLKLDSRIQQHQQDALSSPQHTHRQDLAHALKLSKDMSNFHSSMLSVQVNQRSGQFHPSMTVSQAMSPSIPQIQSSAMSISHASSLIPSLSMSMQQNPAPISVQAPADSTTKPKRSRSRKKKGEINPPPANSQTEETKKSSPSNSFSAAAQQHSQLPHHPSVLNMPPVSQHISTLPMGSHVNHNTPLNHQQNFRNPSSNQYTSRDAQRSQTPSIPQTYSIQEHQTHGYVPVQSPKLSHQNVIRPQSDFILPGNVPIEKSTTPSSCKQQKKSGQSTPKSNQMFRSNIPDNQQHIQNFASHTALLGNTAQHRGSPMQDSRSGGMSRMQNFDNSPQQKMSCQMSPIGQPSPQGSMGTENSGFSANKINNSGHMMGSGLIGSQPPQSPLNSRPVSVEPTSISHTYEQGHSAGMIDTQDSSHFQIDFTGQPFLEQLVGVQPPLVIPSTSYSHTTVDNGEVVFTTLVSPAESARIQQQHDSIGSENFRPTYHGEPVHEIQPIGQIGSHLGMEDVPFNNFFDNHRELEQQGSMSLGGSQQHVAPEPDRMSLTFMPHVFEDDELGHFNQMSQAVPMVKKEPQDPGSKLTSRDSFQDSFLNYLQGHKQETLSSVSSSAVTKKPQLPKYIPEPKRPRPPVVAPQLKESLNFSDAEDSLGVVSSKVKDLISGLSDNDNSSHKSESDREGYSVQRTSELAVKITLPKNKNRNKFGPFAQMTQLKDRNMGRDGEGLLKRKRKKGKRRGSEEDYMPGHTSEDAVLLQEESPREVTPPPVRTSIGRKAKDKCMEKTKKYERHPDAGSSSEESLIYPPKGKTTHKNDDSDKDYDSDKDPIWMPFELDLKQGHDFDEKRKKAKRPRTRMPSTKSGKSSMSQKNSSSSSSTPTSSGNPGTLNTRRPSHTAASTGDTTTATFAAAADSLFKTGTYVIEKKDMHNYENYPLWRLEPGNILRKFEMKAVAEGDGKTVRHQAVGTLSRWMPSMESQFVLVKVREFPGKVKGEPATVEVMEDCKPKPLVDGRLELQYEDDPLVEPFNIYLQVFLSQALEPTFLSAILESNEKFYFDALNQIDGLIEAKCKEITKQAKWKLSFQDYLHMCPLMKEIDRPNLKQACQASENSSPPTIKSVLLSGHPYDRFLLVEKPLGSSDVAQEFMIGKVAASYVRSYHSLYHFKYWLRQRCDAKVKMMKESGKAENFTDEVILEKCLENRSWVLQLFDSLKSLLKCGGDSSR